MYFCKLGLHLNTFSLTVTCTLTKCNTHKQLEVPGAHQSVPSIIPWPTAHKHRPITGGQLLWGIRLKNKRPMGHIAHLRKQFKLINTYDYIISLIKG